MSINRIAGFEVWRIHTNMRRQNYTQCVTGAALSSGGLLGPYLLKKNVFPKLRKWKNFKKYFFQQDAANGHTANATLNLLHKVFGNRVISNRFPSRFFEGWFWPPFSSDLSPRDYFLWGYVKDRCYRNHQRVEAGDRMHFPGIRQCRDGWVIVK